MKITAITATSKTQAERSAHCEAMVKDFAKLCKRLNWQYVYKHDKFIQAFNGDTKQMDWVHEKSGPKVGVIVAYLTPEGQLFMGASRCNIRADKFDRYIGVYNALRDAKPVINKEIPEIFVGVPHSLQRAFAQVFDRFHALAEC